MNVSDVERVLLWLKDIESSVRAGYTLALPAWLPGLVEEVGLKVQPLPRMMTTENMYERFESPESHVYIKLQGGTEIEL